MNKVYSSKINTEIGSVIPRSGVCHYSLAYRSTHPKFKVKAMSEAVIAKKIDSKLQIMIYLFMFFEISILVLFFLPQAEWFPNILSHATQNKPHANRKMQICYPIFQTKTGEISFFRLILNIWTSTNQTERTEKFQVLSSPIFPSFPIKPGNGLYTASLGMHPYQSSSINQFIHHLQGSESLLIFFFLFFK